MTRNILFLKYLKGLSIIILHCLALVASNIYAVKELDINFQKQALDAQRLISVFFIFSCPLA
jgi:hypothetical protein